MDNQREIEPIFPVFLKPKCVVEKKKAHNHMKMENV